MLRFFCFLFLTLALSNTYIAVGQSSFNTYFIQFKDKSNSSYSFSQPQQFLSAKSIERRIRTGVGFDSLDIPVNSSYIQQVLQQGEFKFIVEE